MESSAVLEPLAVSVPEAGDLMRIKRSKAYELVASGEWPSITIGRSRRVPVASLKQWLDAQTSAAETAGYP